MKHIAHNVISPWNLDVWNEIHISIHTFTPSVRGEDWTARRVRIGIHAFPSFEKRPPPSSLPFPLGGRGKEGGGGRFSERETPEFL